jgi:hypothetical protein
MGWLQLRSDFACTVKLVRRQGWHSNNNQLAPASKKVEPPLSVLLLLLLLCV